MRFNGYDLNLLVALEVILTEKNVTRAAKKLNLSQSATSNALARLRLQFNDELLMSSGKTFHRTARADELLKKVRPILAQIEKEVILETSTDPRTAERYIKIIASDYVSLTALGQSLKIIHHEAPGLRFEVSRMHDTPSLLLEKYDIDFLITLDIFAAPSHPYFTYFEDEYVGLVAKENMTLKKKLTQDEYLAMPHIVVRFESGGAPTHDDRYFEQLGLNKNIYAVIPSHALIPYFLAHTDFIATVQRRQAETFIKHFPLKIVELPLTIPPIKEIIQWHAARDGDQILQWLRGRLISTLPNANREISTTIDNIT